MIDNAPHTASHGPSAHSHDHNSDPARVALKHGAPFFGRVDDHGAADFALATSYRPASIPPETNADNSSYSEDHSELGSEMIAAADHAREPYSLTPSAGVTSFSDSKPRTGSSSTARRPSVHSFLKPSVHQPPAMLQDVPMQVLPSRPPSSQGHDSVQERDSSVNLPAGEPAQLALASQQARPGILPSLLAEISFIIICSMGQFLFASLVGNMTVTQALLVDHTFSLPKSQAPWLNGAYLLSNGLSVTISGSLADIVGARSLIIGALAWMCVWCVIGVFSFRSFLLFCVVRAMQGLSVGALTSSSMSYLGRVYKPGLRKNRVFALMASLSPFGFVLGCIQGGALSGHLPWIFGSNAIIVGAILAAAVRYAPTEQAMRAHEHSSGAAASQPPRKFDYIGAALAICGCGLLVFGLTQGASAAWSPYTYASVLAGLAFFGLFAWVEARIAQPLVPPSLWKIKGFVPLATCYFLSFGGFSAWQFYACQYWLRVQNVSPLTASLYLLPNAFVGVIATFIVARLFHIVPGHLILGAGCLASAMGPAFFLPQRPQTSYWALSMPGVAVSTFAPDLSFAAASIWITSNVSRRHQGAGASLLITLQNLSSAVLTSLSETIGVAVEQHGWPVRTAPALTAAEKAASSVSLDVLHAIWWFNFAVGITALLLAVFTLRIPKAEEKEHIQ
ncbi:hypothetical protein EX895_004233 [Sporisorium graminicola]|uniref:Major facilitator superfamily (MFS) profile domain-containing protein n=1 Tax=Sporisorium graminicola TaxID=280036 RepID=A0A4U7KQZ6_9BASI|nr:hypothetical protein EX895_004233 [Sporisorium graminicola]TKY86945.1 hypothetical protein EX895_004233 [Sporisorium graminicola]